MRVAVYESGPVAAEVSWESDWPPADLTWSSLYLSRDGLLEEPAAAAKLTYDSSGPGLAFEWKLPADRDLIGPMALRLYLSAVDNPDPHVFVAVQKLHDGVTVPFAGSLGFNLDAVTVGWQRPAFRELDQQLSAPYRRVHTFRNAKPLAAGEIVPVDVELREDAPRFRAGDVFRLEVRGHWHFPRNPVTGHFPAGYRSSKGGSCVVHMGTEHPSALLLGYRPAGGAADRAG